MDALSNPSEIVQRIRCPEYIQRELHYLVIEHCKSKLATSGIKACTKGNIDVALALIDLSKYLPIFQALNSRVVLEYFQRTMSLARSIAFNSILDFYNPQIVAKLCSMPRVSKDVDVPLKYIVMDWHNLPPSTQGHCKSINWSYG